MYWPYAGAAANLQRDPGSAKLFFRNGKLLQKGDTYRNPDLADMLQKLADKGSAYEFYRGEIGRQIADAFQKNGGLVTADDMAKYRPLEVEPLQLNWRGHTIATAPLTAGGLTILQTIATLKALGDDWEHLPKNSPMRTQAWLEALRISWGDRLRMFGDPRHVEVPVKRLLSAEYAQESAKKIQLAMDEKRPVPVSTDGRTAGGTVHLSAVDGEGMMACVTLTHGDSFGAQVTVDGLGLLLGHGMSRFDPVPGRPNSIAPGKRPLDNMSPTIVLRDGKPMLAIGAAGGRRIPNGVFEVLLNLIVDGRSLEDAVTEPRLHTEGGLAIHAERGRPEAEIQYLKQIGYTIAGPQQCYVAAVQIDPAKKNGRVVGVADVPPENGPGVRNPHPVVIIAAEDSATKLVVVAVHRIAFFILAFWIITARNLRPGRRHLCSKQRLLQFELRYWAVEFGAKVAVARAGTGTVGLYGCRQMRLKVLKDLLTDMKAQLTIRFEPIGGKELIGSSSCGKHLSSFAKLIKSNASSPLSVDFA